MQIVVVAGFVVVVVMTAVAGDAHRPGPWWLPPVCVVGYVLLGYVGTRAAAALGLRRLLRPTTGGPSMGKAPALLAAMTRAYLVVALAAVIGLGWGAFVSRTLGLRGVPLVGWLVAAAPFVIALIVHWWALYPLEQAVRLKNAEQSALAGEPVMPVWSRRQFVGFNIRHHLLFIAVPVSLIILAADVLMQLQAAEVISPSVAGYLALAAAGVVFTFAPTMIVRIWRARPLPAGALRARLEDMCRRLRLRYRRILLWETGGVVVNAGVVGFFGPARYVLLSDAMLTHFDDDAVTVIFAHEAGHVVHRHIPYMIAFSAGLLMGLSAAGKLIGRLGPLAGHGQAVEAATALLAGGAWVVLFGMLSRRFERQADVFAATIAGSPADGPAILTPWGVDLFARALLSVGRLNGIAPTKWNFRHGSIQRRVDFLQDLFAAGGGPEWVDRRIGLIKLGIWVLLAAGVVSQLP